MRDPSCWADHLDADAIQAQFADWIESNRWNSFDAADLAAVSDYYGYVTPRSIFLKNLAADAKLLDLGAGNGTLSVYREWPGVKRRDIKMYATSLEVGEHFGKYEAYEIANFEESLPKFGDIQFDAVICTHFIEHLRDPERCIQWISSRLARRGRVFFEWPHPMSKKMPKNTFFQSLGLKVFTTNFFDDGSHIEAWPMADIVDLCHRHGLHVETCGRMHYERVATLYNHIALKSDDLVFGTFSVWLYVGWPQYLVAFKN